MKILLSFILALALVSCTAINKQVTLDLTGAAAMAKASGASARSACYLALAPIFATTPKGAASLYEQVAEAQELIQGPCAVIVAGIGLMVLQHTPIVIPVP